MDFKIRIKFNSMINILMVLLFCSFTILTTYSWGRYVMILCVAAILGLGTLRDGWKYKFLFGRYIITLLLFTLYVLMSVIWAESPSDAFAKAKTLFEILIMVVILYNCYYGNQNCVQDLLWVVKWASVFVVLYSLLFFGIDNLIVMVSAEERMENTYANVNTIGMLAAIGAIIQLDELIQDKKIKLSEIFCVPSVFLIAATQSRKAFVILLFGISMDIVLNNSESKNFTKKIFKLLLSIVAAIIVLNIILSLPMFSGMLERMGGIIASITGGGGVDSSTRIRQRMVEVGFEQFLKTPFLGMGIGNPHLLAARHLGKDTYLHNNFIELLAGGGIIGCGIYYSMYIYLFANLWKYRKYKNREYIVCAIIMVLLLAMDYGMVSYYTKSRYIYLMLYFLEVETLKRNAKEYQQGRCMTSGNKEYSRKRHQIPV